MEKHDIGRIYMRFFDVTVEDLYDGRGAQPIPTATVRIDDKHIRQEVVPVVYITVEALRNMQQKKTVDMVAAYLVERVRNMCSFYSLNPSLAEKNVAPGDYRELQLDCDWTTRTEEIFFELCQAVRKHVGEERCLTCTIRLHQLRQAAPPVDRGMLMLYNTNNLRNPKVRNSILDPADVKPYLKNVEYQLPLDFAYPNFKWDLWFKDGQFRGIVRDKQMADSLRNVGDQVRHEEVEYRQIYKVKEMVEKALPQAKQPHITVLYHLDKNNIKRYKSNEIERIFGN